MRAAAVASAAPLVLAVLPQGLGGDANRREEILGGSACYFSTCASYFGPVRVVAVVDPEALAGDAAAVAAYLASLGAVARK